MNIRLWFWGLFVGLVLSGIGMVVVGAVVPMKLNGILIGAGVLFLVLSGWVLFLLEGHYFEGKGGDNKKPSPEEDLEKGAGDAVDQQLLEERMAALYKFKILILGAGESGKSTVVKQLRLVHSAKITPQQQTEDANMLHSNIIDCFGAVIGAANRFKIPFTGADAETAATVVKFQGPRIPQELVKPMLDLFHCEAFQQTYARRAEYWVLDAFSYYMKNFDRITASDFVPTEEDSLMVRIRTTGIVVTELESKVVKVNPDDPASIKFVIVDVGGQRNERKKWIHCFDDVKAVLFVASLAGYNQVMYEDNEMNRLQEDLNLFEEMSKKEIFAKTPFFLFLNKKDLFEVMIREKSLEYRFPEFKGGDDVHASLSFLEGEFRKRLPPGKDLLVQPVASVWRRDIKAAFEEVKKALIDKNKEAIQAEMKKIKAELKKK